MELPTITDDDIRSVYPEIPPDRKTDSAIASARMLVQTSIVDSGCGANYSQEQLKLILTWLAAHIWQVSNGVLSSISAGSSSESYQMSTDFFLKGTLHGQNAMLMDSNHCLAQLMADTDLALQGRQSFVPTITSVHSHKQTILRRKLC